MRRKYGAVLALLILCFGLGSLSVANAQTASRDYFLVTGNGRYIFVMLSSEQNSPASSTLRVDRTRYTHSGLYTYGGEAHLLWTVDWYSAQVYISSDGEHLIRMGPWPKEGAFSELAVAFYDKGQLMREYSVSNLVADPSSLPVSAGHYGWLKASTFLDVQGALEIETLNDEQYDFDITTGEFEHGAIGPTASQFLLLLFGIGATTILLAGLVVLTIRLAINKSGGIGAQ